MVASFVYVGGGARFGNAVRAARRVSVSQAALWQCAGRLGSR